MSEFECIYMDCIKIIGLFLERWGRGRVWERGEGGGGRGEREREVGEGGGGREREI